LKKLFSFLLSFSFVFALSNSDVIVNYYMDECLWGKVIDFSGNGYFAEPQNDANTTAGGVINNDGNLTVHNYLVPDKAITVEGNYTIKLWVKWPLDDEGHTDYKSGSKELYYFNIADRDGSDDDFIYFAKYIDGSDVSWYFCIDDNVDDDHCKRFTPPSNGWHMITIVANGDDLNTKFYIDKSLKLDRDYYSSGDLILIGASDYKDDENGQTIGSFVDEYIIFNKALSEDEIDDVYDNESAGKNFDGSDRLQYFLCEDTDPGCDLENGLKFTTYDIKDYSDKYPENHAEYDDLEAAFAKMSYEFGYGFKDNITFKYYRNNNPYQEDPDKYYMSLFEGYIYIPEAGTYSFAVNGEDAVEVNFGDNEDVYYGWYGKHVVDGTDHNFSMSFGKKGYYKIKFRHEHWSLFDNYRLYWKKPGDSDFEVVPGDYFFHCKIPRPVAEYRMDECVWDGSDGDVKDSSGNGNDITSRGGAHTAKGGVIEREGVFDGENTKIQGTWNQTFTNQVTLSAWFKTEVDQNWFARIVEFSRDDGDYQYDTALAFDKNGEVIRGWTANNDKKRTDEVTYDLKSNGYFDGEWHQVVFTYNDGDIKLYLDGVEVNSTTSNIGDITDGATLCVGGYYKNDDHNFNGALDEVKIFDKALDKKQVEDYYIDELHKFNFDGTKRPFVICQADEPGCGLENGLWFSTYNIEDYSQYYPNNHSDYNELEDEFADSEHLFGEDRIDKIYTTAFKDNNPFQEDPDDKYLSIFEGYIYIPEPGIYSFAVNGDDAVEALFKKDESVYYGWYGGHAIDSTDHNFQIYFYKKGYYKFKFRHQEWLGQDSYRFYWKKPGDSKYKAVPEDNLFYCKVSYIFDAWDVDEDNTTRYIKTKIVNNEFNLSIVSMDKNTSEETEFNGTVCVRLVSGEYNSSWQKILFEEEKEKNETFNIDRAVKDARINIVWLIDQNVSCPIDSDDANETNSTDNFAVRPEKFTVQNTVSSVKAGNEFNLSIKAVDNSGAAVKDYNETVYIRGDSVDLEYNETKSGCATGELDKRGGGEFADGESNITLAYDNVGELNITIKEVNGSEFALVDSDDTPDNDRFISPAETTIGIGVDHFKLSAAYENYDAENNFTYYDDELNISSHLELNISAVDKDGNVVTNYNKECYAKDISVNIAHNDVDVNVSKILFKYVDTASNAVDENVSVDDNLTFTYSKENFTTDDNGSTRVDVYINFDRNLSNPVNPFEFNLTDVDVNDTDANGSLTLNKAALYYYGNVVIDDILAVEDDFNKTYYFTVYDDNSSDPLIPNPKEVKYSWYYNILHNATDGNVTDSEIVISRDYNSSNTISGVDVSVKDIQNGNITFEISRSDTSIKFVVVHLLSPNLRWLWYSKFGEKYDISDGSTCLNHFCFSISWQDITTKGEVGSGTFNGTEANVTDTNSTKRGVKIFR